MEAIENASLQKVWNHSLVVLTFAVCLLGSLGTVVLSEEKRWKTERNIQPTWLLSFMIAVCFGGVNMWSVLMLEISSYHLENGEHTIFGMKVDIYKSAESLAFGIFFAFLGVTIASRDKFYSVSVHDRYQTLRQEIFENPMIEQARENVVIRQLAFLEGIGWIFVGGIVAGSGVCLVRLLEISSIATDVEISWNWSLLFFSYVFAIMSSSFSFWILFRLLAWRPFSEILRFGSAISMTLSICGFHYASEFSCRYLYNPTIPPEVKPHVVEIDWLSISGAAVGVAFSSVYYAYSSSYKKLRVLVEESDEAKKLLENTNQRLEPNNEPFYKRTRGLHMFRI